MTLNEQVIVLVFILLFEVRDFCHELKPPQLLYVYVYQTLFSKEWQFSMSSDKEHFIYLIVPNVQFL